MNSRASAWLDAIVGFRRRAAATPSLWLVPAGLVLVWRAFAAVRLPASANAAVGVVLIMAAHAVFAEAWAARGRGFDADRLFETGVLFLLTVPSILVFDAVALVANSRVMLGEPEAALAAARALYLGANALVVAASALAALSVGELSAEGGAPDALRRGWSVFRRRLLFVAALAAVTAVLHSGVGRVWELWRTAAVDAGGATVAAGRFFKDVLRAALPMFFGVAAPLYARECGLLEGA